MTKRPYSTEGFQRDEYLVDGVRSVVYSAGSGAPVVYFHGGGTFHGFEWARDWTDRFRVILPYHPGFGESADDTDITSMADYVVHYTALLEALGLSRIGLAGTSLGGRLAAEFALTHSAMVDRLVLIAPAGLSSPDHPSPDFATTPPSEIPKLLVADEAFVRRFWPVDAGAEFMAARGREAVSTGRVLADGEAANRKLRRLLPLLNMPTLILWGGQDDLLLPGLAQHWANAIPGSKVGIVEEGGHLLLDESPRARKVAAEFLSST